MPSEPGRQPAPGQGAEDNLPVLHFPRCWGAFGFDPEDLGLQRHIVDTGGVRRRARELLLRAEGGQTRRAR